MPNNRRELLRDAAAFLFRAACDYEGLPYDGLAAHGPEALSDSNPYKGKLVACARAIVMMDAATADAATPPRGGKRYNPHPPHPLMKPGPRGTMDIRATPLTISLN